MGKINNSFKIPMNKPDMGIVTSQASRLHDITFQKIWMSYLFQSLKKKKKKKKKFGC